VPVSLYILAQPKGREIPLTLIREPYQTVQRFLVFCQPRIFPCLVLFMVLLFLMQDLRGV
jgi:hypothetical protein